jgi:YLP motif-containing protein 1
MNSVHGRVLISTQDREVEMGGSAPRILSLDDYFMTETEKTVKDPVTGVETKETLMQYEYEEDLEPKYRNDLVKTFKKNVENGYFQFIIVDGVNSQVKHFEEMVTCATQRRFQVSNFLYFFRGEFTTAPFV